jgi:hypothetical protein
MKVEILTDDFIFRIGTYWEEMLFVNICGQVKEMNIQDSNCINKVLTRKWLVASLGTDGSCLLHVSGLAFSIHDSQ